jgi:hypothetical protein
MKPERREIATTIANDPTNYKLCAVCGAIIARDAASCPDCYAYRFDTDTTHVQDAALDMAIKPQTAVRHFDLMAENAEDSE